MTVNFKQKLLKNYQQNKSLLCIGLDPDPNKMPPILHSKGGTIYAFCKEIIDATADLVCAYKPQIAYFSAYHAEDQLEQIIGYIHENYPYIPVILDAKRGDIGSTAHQYAVEVFERYQADAVTINPYMGFDTIEPFLSYEDKGVFALCRTSNKSGDEIQNLQVEDKPLYLKMAQIIKNWDKNNSGNLGLVVGATYPQELALIREIVGEMPILVPGIGTQGGDIKATINANKIYLKPHVNLDASTLLINSSRAILYASMEDDFAQKSREVAKSMLEEINQALYSI